MKSLDFQSAAAAEAVPGLLLLVRDQELPWYTRKQAALTLGRIGEHAESAVPVFRSLLANDDRSEPASTAAWAAKAIALMGPIAAKATPELATVLHDKSRTHVDRLSCVEALARIGGASDHAVAALLKLIETDIGHTHEAHELQAAAVDGLALVGPQASPAVPMLIRLTSDDSGPLRKKSAVALGAIGPPSGIAAASLAELVIFDDLQEVREAAAASLATIGDAGTLALRKLLSDLDPSVRRLAAISLGTVLRTNDENTEALHLALKDEDTSVRLRAAESLWNTTKYAEEILPVVLETLTSEDRQLRIGAYRLLVSLGPAAKSAIPDLQRLAEDERPYVQQVANKALMEIDN
ncbi:MAG: HEAT repeat domain-containing protein [Planctomycetaceae bacterium]|nr:HEAT repeat domain-containing protein [Planctomycetaceae bacterium]